MVQPGTDSHFTEMPFGSPSSPFDAGSGERVYRAPSTSTRACEECKRTSQSYQGRLADLLMSNALERFFTNSPEPGLAGSSSALSGSGAAQAPTTQLEQLSTSQWQQIIQSSGLSDQQQLSEVSFGTPIASFLDTSWPIIGHESGGFDNDFTRPQQPVGNQSSPPAEHYASQIRLSQLLSENDQPQRQSAIESGLDEPCAEELQTTLNPHNLERQFELPDGLMNFGWQSSGITSGGPVADIDGGPAAKASMFTIDTPADRAGQLLDLFFSHIQCFLPLLHRPRFCAEFDKIRHCLGGQQQLDLDTALILNGIFALSARFAPLADFPGSEPKSRGAPYAEKAQWLFDHWRQRQDGAVTLKILQGSILLAFYQLSSGIDFKGLVSAGVCCRMAYTLSLHRIDVDLASTRYDEEIQMNIDEWADKEEKRRAWWACWELDTFSSTIACQPFIIDLSRIDVHLPVSDEAWFGMKPVVSAPLASRRPFEVWRSLKESPNQNDYAWYLISNCLMRQAQQMFENREATIDVLENFQATVNCCALSLPSRFSISSANITFNDTNFSSGNYIIGTHLMLQNIFATILLHSAEPRDTPPSMSNGSTSSNSRNSSSSYETVANSCSRYRDEVLRAMKLWSPDFMAMASPFLVCAIPGPFAINFRTRCAGDETSYDINRQMLVLVIKRQAVYWDLASMLLELESNCPSPERVPGSSAWFSIKITSLSLTF
ncbi:fungal-specific transcription factor domain-containing protein [Leptodontidium sp. 2 PMI_412]|nr:fungal-specific transcription factor domain-containing protein [Leptodontidium sp. 2 PMI_412]